MILSTIHQAKGLEWDTVFIIHLTDQSFPSRRALSEEDGMEEERRLFYVAVTRARKRLFLSYPMTVGYDTLVLGQPSTFLEEVNPRLFERVELRTAFGRRSSTSSAQWRSGDAESTTDGGDWAWEEPVIQIDSNGERRVSAGNPKASVWKKSGEDKPKPKPGSFLRDISDL
jgi:ATP-dependent exoDNAse (exonuclease V) beta subunit